MSDLMLLTTAYNWARDALQRNNVDGASALLKHILAYYPKALRANELLGDAFTVQGKLEEALNQYALVTSVYPEDASTYAKMASIAEQLGCAEEAARYHALATDHFSGRNGQRTPFPQVISPARLAILNLRSGLAMQAIHQLGTILQQDCDRLDLYLVLARALWLANLSTKAEKVAEIILVASPDCLPAHIIAGAIAAGDGRRQEAKQHFDRAYETDPTGEVIQPLTADYELGDLLERPAPTLPRFPLHVPASTFYDFDAWFEAKVLSVAEAYPPVEEEQGEPELDTELPAWLESWELQAAEPKGTAVTRPTDVAPTPPTTMANLRDRLAQEPLNNSLRFEYAQALEEAGELDQAVQQYGIIVRSRDPRLLPEIQNRLESLQAIGRRVHGLWRTLGDVYMQRGLYERAIDAYSLAFDELRSRQLPRWSR
jgi:tetratricopeptide (TPR) repeat protein